MSGLILATALLSAPDLAELPALTELQRFPPADVATDRLCWLYQRRRTLEMQYAAQLQHERYYTLALADVEQAIHAWEALRAAQWSFVTGTEENPANPERLAEDDLRRRRILSELRGMLGNADFCGGTLP